MREIYLKGFEIAVKEGNADSIMTTYGAVNGIWTAGSYDLNTVILRNEWGFDGFVMTDWWADINERGKMQNKTNFAAMAKAQNDVYMVCADGSDNDDNTLEELEKGNLKRAELQRNAANICNFIMHTNAMKRYIGKFQNVEVINRPDNENANDEPVVFYDIDECLELSLEDVSTEKGTNYCFALVIKNPGVYDATITASSEQGELAQIPVTLFAMGTANGVYTWHGTNGKPVSITRDLPMFSRYVSVRLYFAQSGLKLHSIEFKLNKNKKLENI